MTATVETIRRKVEEQSAFVSRLRDEIGRIVVGQQYMVDRLMLGILANGHVLVEGVPGLAKTTAIKTLANAMHCQFSRIQFTPDLLPADLIGTLVYNPKDGGFTTKKGPVFANIILADEINRTSPRTQSAFLEAMSERQISVDGTTYSLERPFFVVATENHLSSAGAFPLPDSQLDRFLLSFEMPAPDLATQARIVALHANGEPGAAIRAGMKREDLLRCQDEVRGVRISDNVAEYVARLCQAVREAKEFVCGASSRAAIALMQAARVQAYLDGRSAVYPDDVKRTMPCCFRHRLTLKVEAGQSMEHVHNRLLELLDDVPVPATIR